MATAAITGKNGTVTGTGAPGSVGDEITNWDATLETDLEDATSMDSGGYKEYIEGLTGMTGSFTAIGTPPTTGALTDLELAVSSTAGALKFNGAAIVSNLGVATPVDGRVEYSCDFSYTGAITVGAVV